MLEPDELPGSTVSGPVKRQKTRIAVVGHPGIKIAHPETVPNQEVRRVVCTGWPCSLLADVQGESRATAIIADQVKTLAVKGDKTCIPSTTLSPAWGIGILQAERTGYFGQGNGFIFIHTVTIHITQF